MRAAPFYALSRCAASRLCRFSSSVAGPSRIVEVRERQRGTLGVGAAPLASDSPIDVTAMEVFAAAHRIRQGEDGIKRTSMYHSRRLSTLLGMEIFLKHEFTHPTGSFKERGGCVGARA
jgi:hypothetical protein